MRGSIALNGAACCTARDRNDEPQTIFLKADPHADRTRVLTVPKAILSCQWDGANGACSLVRYFDMADPDFLAMVHQARLRPPFADL